MKTFDYARAWIEVAKPAYDALPEEIHALVAVTADAAKDLSQRQDLNMPWPTDQPWADLRHRFDSHTSDSLALAARVLHDVGHWRPGRDVDAAKHVGPLDACPGLGWKFANYADQILRERLQVPDRVSSSPNGLSLAVLEGAIRVCYSSRDMWLWEEVAPATEEGKARVVAEVLPKLRTFEQFKTRNDRDGAAYAAFEALRTDGSPLWPVDWQRLVTAGQTYQTDDQSPTYGAPGQHAKRLDRQRDDLLKHTEQKIAELTETKAVMLWLLDHGLSTENAIYYNHKHQLCFGWRDKVGPDFESQILAVISECPYSYEIRCADGRVLNGD
jgi:hypothetical protein